MVKFATQGRRTINESTKGAKLMITESLEREAVAESPEKLLPFDERVFIAEIKRVDAELIGVKKSAEKQEDKFTRALEKLEATLDSKFEKIDQRFEKMEQKLDSNFKWLVGIYIPLTGMLLAAFYAFATFTRP